MTCPQCKSEKFYVKDPEDAYDTHEFETGKDGFQFADPECALEISAEQKIYCSCCAWHGRFAELN